MFFNTLSKLCKLIGIKSFTWLKRIRNYIAYSNFYFLFMRLYFFNRRNGFIIRKKIAPSPLPKPFLFIAKVPPRQVPYIPERLLILGHKL